MKILAFGAHPDDLETGMGGTIARYVKEGHEVLMVVVTIPNEKETRKKEAEKAAEILGAKILILDIIPEEVVFCRKLVGIFDKLIIKNKPHILYIPWCFDSHQDHYALSHTLLSSARKNDCSVYMYEQTIPGGIVPQAFKPQIFIDVSKEFDAKLESIRAHRSQLEANNESWLAAVEGRAQFRGYQINVKYAEVFEPVKLIKGYGHQPI